MCYSALKVSKSFHHQVLRPRQFGLRFIFLLGCGFIAELAGFGWEGERGADFCLYAVHISLELICIPLAS